MLVELRLKNFRSFRDEQRFSMVASSDTALPNNVIETEALGKERLVRSAVIYGANAAGKSNLIEALDFVQDFVGSSDVRRPGEPIPIQPFRLDATATMSPSEFEITFIEDGVRYQYGFIVDRQRIYEEWLYAYPKRKAQRWFTRMAKSDGIDSDWYFGPSLRGDWAPLQEFTRPEVLFLTVAARFNQRQLAKVYSWFSHDLRVILGKRYSEDFFEDLSASLADESEVIRGSLTRLLQVADLGISDFVLEKRPRFREEHLPPNLAEDIRNQLLQESSFLIQMRHRTHDAPDSGVLFAMQDESVGTQRLFGLGGPLWVVLRTGCLLAVDELDASLHPTLVRWIVNLFHRTESNRSNAQLVFNTHDTTLLDATLFRRDQIWFVEKDETGASNLFPLLEYRPRKDEALAKGYLRGRYGAIPFLNDTWQEVDEHMESQEVSAHAKG